MVVALGDAIVVATLPFPNLFKHLLFLTDEAFDELVCIHPWHHRFLMERAAAMLGLANLKG